jgi:hypothetical protein
VRDFLDQTFSSPYESEKHSKATKLIKYHGEIASRPIILAYIRDIVDSNQEINTTLDFYDTIVAKELYRNISRIQPTVTDEQVKQWWNMTSEVAGFMYKNKQGKTEITYDELLQILIEYQLAKPNDTINEDLFQQRSLLTRTGDIFHFSHKSFYEYFMAYRFLIHPEEIGSIRNLDFTLKLFNNFYDAVDKEIEPKFIKFTKTPRYIFDQAIGKIIDSQANNIYRYSSFCASARRRTFNNYIDFFNKMSTINAKRFLPLKAKLQYAISQYYGLNNPTIAIEYGVECLETIKSYRDKTGETTALQAIKTNLTNFIYEAKKQQLLLYSFPGIGFPY